MNKYRLLDDVFNHLKRCRSTADFDAFLGALQDMRNLYAHRRSAFELGIDLQYGCGFCGTLMRKDDKACLECGTVIS